MKISQGQQQQQQMLQRLKQTQFQVQQSALLAMSLGELEATVRDALNDNPALERASDGDDYGDTADTVDTVDTVDSADSIDSIDRNDTFDSSDSDIMEVYGSRQSEQFDVEAQQSLFGDTQSLRDHLKEQTIELQLTEADRYIIDYLINSIDDDGFLHDSPDTIADTLAIYHGIDTTEADIERLLHEIQRLDPAGVGARNLKECLLLQAARIKQAATREQLTQLIDSHFDDVCQNNWLRIRQQMSLTRDEALHLQRELRRLNPRPGRSLGVSGSATLEQIVPDFTIEVSDTGRVTFTMNKGHVPQLSIADSFVDIIERSKNHKLSRGEQEALVYARDKVQAGRNLIAAIERRWQMLHDTMAAIIAIQHRFFIDGDDASLVAMTLKDVAERVGVSLSTISRVSNEKYADTPWGIFPLKHFFTQASNVGAEGEAVSHKSVTEALREIIAAEPATHPYIDDELVEQMRSRGYECSRRTIAKYRSILGIPTAKMRRRQE